MSGQVSHSRRGKNEPESWFEGTIRKRVFLKATRQRRREKFEFEMRMNIIEREQTEQIFGGYEQKEMDVWRAGC